MKTLEITMKFDRETKGTVRYAEQGVDRPYTLYVLKSDLGTPYPQEIKMTVEAVS